MKSFSVLRIWAEHGMRSSAEATPVRRSRMDLEFLRGNLARTESDLPSQSIPCPRICVRRRPALTPGKGERKGWMNWIKEQLNAGRAAHVIADLRPTRTGCVATSAGNADCRSAPASWKALACTSSVPDSNRRSAAC